MKKLALQVLLAAVAITSAAGSLASERVKICAKQSGGKAYQVEAVVLTGQELNEKTSSFRYNAFNYYAVIFWAKGEATVIDTRSAFPPGPISATGVDQENRSWMVAASEVCF